MSIPVVSIPWQRWILPLLLFGLVGCAGPRIDWAARVGSYTLDQAIMDYGPPDKQAKLTDGTTVSEWMIRRGGYSPVCTGFGYDYPFWTYSGPWYPSYIDSYTPSHFLRLVFAPDGRMKSWKKFAK